MAAGTAIKWKNEKDINIRGLMLITPMLDDRVSTVSARQFEGFGALTAEASRLCWNFGLVAPSRATDLAGLPATYIDAGECEVFRDEVVAFASTLWSSGVSAELHIWPGAPHGFEYLAPTAPVSQTALDTKVSWVKRIAAPE
jgi:acetyl esterase/lipase